MTVRDLEREYFELLKMPLTKAAQILHLTPKTMHDRTKIADACVRSGWTLKAQAAKDVLLKVAEEDEDPFAENSDKSELEDILKDKGLSNAQWILVTTVKRTGIGVIGKVGSQLVFLRAEKSRAEYDWKHDYVEVVKIPRKNSVLKTVRENSYKWDERLWMNWPGGKLTSQMFNHLMRRERGLPLKEAIIGSPLDPFNFQTSKKNPVVYISWKEDPHAKVWKELQVSSAKELERAKEEKSEEIVKLTDTCYKLLLSIVLDLYSVRKTQVVGAEVLKTRDEYMRKWGIIGSNASNEDIMFRDLDGMAQELKGYNEVDVATLRRTALVRDTKAYELISLDNQFIEKNFLQKYVFHLGILGQEFRLSERTEEDPKLAEILADLVRRDTGQGAHTFVVPREINTLLLTLEDALTDEPTELFLKIRQVVESMTGFPKIAGKQSFNKIALQRCLREYPTSKVAEEWGVSVSDILTQSMGRTKTAEAEILPDATKNNFRKTKGWGGEVVGDSILGDGKTVWTRGMSLDPQILAAVIYAVKNGITDSVQIRNLPWNLVKQDTEAALAAESLEEVQSVVDKTKPFKGELAFRNLIEITKKYSKAIASLPITNIDDYWEQFVLVSKTGASYVRYSRALKEARDVQPLSFYTLDHAQDVDTMYEKIRKTIRFTTLPDWQKENPERLEEEYHKDATAYVTRVWAKYVTTQDKLEIPIQNVLKFNTYKKHFVFDTLNSTTISADDARNLCPLSKLLEVLQPLPPVEKDGWVDYIYNIYSILKRTPEGLDAKQTVETRVEVNIFNDAKEQEHLLTKKSGRVPVTLVWQALKKLGYWCSTEVMTTRTFTEADLAILKELSAAIAANSRNKGFKSPPPGTGITQEQWDSEPFAILRASIMVANQHAETSEFWEAGRRASLGDACTKSEKMVALGLPPLTDAEEEVADILIRGLDLADAFGVDPAKAVVTKMAYNVTRPIMHGKLA